MKRGVYLIPPAVFAPAILTTAAIIAGAMVSLWILLAIPFIWLGSICAAPNLNLANGCLAYVTMLLGMIVMAFFIKAGLPIELGAMLGYFLSALEKGMRMRLMPED